MNRTLLSLLAALLTILMLSACSGETDTPSETAPAITAVPAAAESQTPFEVITLVDDENCTVQITSVDADNIWGYTLNVYLENRTDLDLMFTLDEVSVNGYMFDPFWASTVSAGKKSNEEISFLESDFETNGITEVSEISFTLRVYDSNDWSADHLVEDVFSIHP